MEYHSKTPEGELVLQAVAMPKDANAYGDIFGGWLLSQMDVGGAVLAHNRANNRVTTVAVENMSFLKPVYVGDLVSCYAIVEKQGRSSITIKVQVWVKRLRIHESLQVAQGTFVYVALNEQGKAKHINWDNSPF